MNSSVPAIPASGLLKAACPERSRRNANGNLLNSGADANVYDFENRLIQAGNVRIVAACPELWRRNGDGNRVQETAGGTTTFYLISDLNPTGYPQVVQEQSVTGTFQKTYFWGLDLLRADTLVLDLNPFGIVVGQHTDTSYYGHDGHGSVRYLTDGTGRITDTYDYDAFGNLIASTGSTINNYLFAGEWFDPVLGVYYNRARYYDERRGRFWTMDIDQGDPESPISLHKYLYASCDPVGQIDPTGKASLGELQVVQGASKTIDDAEAEEDLAAYQALTNFIARGSAATAGTVSTVAKIVTWTLSGLILATSVSAPFFAVSSDAVLTNYHDPNSAALYAFGNNQAEKDANSALYLGPREPRIGGYNRAAGDVNNDLETDATGMLEPNSPQPWPKGASTWDFPTSAPLTGAFWGTRTDNVYATSGLGLKVDGADVGGPQPAGHRTVYPSAAMSPKEFISKWFRLGWVKAGTKK